MMLQRTRALQISHDENGQPVYYWQQIVHDAVSQVSGQSAPMLQRQQMWAKHLHRIGVPRRRFFFFFFLERGGRRSTGADCFHLQIFFFSLSLSVFSSSSSSSSSCSSFSLVLSFSTCSFALVWRRWARRACRRPMCGTRRWTFACITCTHIHCS